MKGKDDYITTLGFGNHQETLKKRGRLVEYDRFDKNSFGYILIQEDAKKLSLASESVDYIFTDPPYGDKVPYFEQSIIWNSWLDKVVPYDEEIVVSNSNQRGKRSDG